MMKRNEEWLLQLISLLKDEQQLTIALDNATSDSKRKLLTNRLNEVLAKKTAYESYELLSVYELLNNTIDDERLINILTVGSKYAKEKRKVVLRISRNKPSNPDTFNDFIIALILYIVSRNYAFAGVITAMMLAEKMETLTYREEEIIIKTVNKTGGNYE